MFAFLLTYVAVYGGVHAYLFWQARRSFCLGALPGACLGVFFAAMVAAPILTRLLDRREVTVLARPLAWVGYSWMAAAFWLFLLFLSRDLWNLAAVGSARIFPAAPQAALPLRGSALAFLFAVLLAGFWGLREAGDIRLEEVTVHTPHLPPGSPPVRLAFVADVHADLLVGERRLQKIADLVRRAKPDAVLSGGDLVDASAAHLSSLSRIFADLRPRLGKYAVTGNHEYYAGVLQSERFAAAAGFRMLHGESVLVEGRLLLVGVDDPTARQMGLPATPPEGELLPREEARPAVVLLKHRPAVAAGSTGRFDLQLSGHTHRGQLWPFRYLVSLEYPLPDGLSSAGRGSVLYKSRGTGTWGPPLRFLAPPEVTLVVLVPAG
ncbi:MAG: metallophosphoesterase [Deltaproteobacteria bacterium]|nr:metallophosphoesterase [Deltaproteobacteria bacterium]